MPMQAVIGTKVELRLNDPMDSTLGRKAVPPHPLRDARPVRDRRRCPLTAQICLPRIDGASDEPSTAQDGLDVLV